MDGMQLISLSGAFVFSLKQNIDALKAIKEIIGSTTLILMGARERAAFFDGSKGTSTLSEPQCGSKLQNPKSARRSASEASSLRSKSSLYSLPNKGIDKVQFIASNKAACLDMIKSQAVVRFYTMIHV